MIDSQVPAGRYYAYYTVEPPNGEDDTIMYLFSSQWYQKAYNDNGGVGYNAAIWATADSGDRVVIGTWLPTMAGYTRLVIDPCFSNPEIGASENCDDPDGDHLSTALEDEIGTNPGKFDTDGDGLNDWDEVIGRIVYDSDDSLYHTQALVPFGASPFHKDLFVETDRQNTVAPLQQSWVDTMRDTYNALSTISNPDGTTGVHIHVDTGQPCSGEPAVCGDWGGSQDGLPYGDGSPYPSAAAYAASYSDVKQFGYFDPARWGAFHYVYLTDDSTCNSTGETEHNPGTTSFAAGNCSDGSTPYLAQHELGHELGLDHWGAHQEPLQQMNAKLTYPSLMNYVFQDPGNNKPTPRFSDGSRAAIHPYDLPETNYSPNATVADLSYLGEAPLNFLVHLVSQPEQHQVDFNRDGRFGVPDQSGVVPSGSTTAVAFDTSPIGTAATGAGWPELYGRDSVDSTGELPQGGAGLAVDPTAASGTTVWRVEAYATLNGNLTNFDLTKGTFDDTTPWQWDTSVQIGQMFSDGGDASLTWFPVGNDDLVALYPDSAGALDYSLIDTSNPGASYWNQIPGTFGGIRNASATVSGGKLVVVFRDPNINVPSYNVYITTVDSSGNWSTPELVQGVSSLVTPGVAEAADGTLYMAIADGSAGASGPFPIEFFRKGSGSLGDGTGWQPTGLGSIGSSLSVSAHNDAGARINLLSVPYLDQNLTPFPDGSGYLAVFWSTGDPTQASGEAQNWHLMRAYTTGYFSPNGDTAGPPEGSGWHRQQQYDRAYPGDSVAVAEHDGNVMALYTGSYWGTKNGTPGPYPNSTWFAPYVTGIVPVGSGYGIDGDNDDGATIAAGMCPALALFTYGDCSQAAIDKASCYCSTYDGNPSCSNPPFLWTETGNDACP